ncbi:GntR family transcriptional regulator [uncultured Xylophilus sp.]|uniref:GntR family transcriptional regulator n=1 Tax=uncultured Xylophilus sp. TaxID=296832 RepID=UPI0025D3F7E2|nr:GntR family transcriptional regulator [uncultured Xylophilus sp.]
MNSKTASTTVHTSLLERLREVFVAGEFVEGDKVPEAALCERFGVSRTPLREALKVLAAEGHVELLPNRGARVRALSIAEAEGLFSVAGALEALAGEQACERISPEEIDALQTMHDEMRACRNRHDMAAYYALNMRIHSSIVDATRNPVLIGVYSTLNARISRIRFASPMSDDIWARAMAEHEGMQNALMRRDGAALSSILKTHLKHKCESILASMTAQQAATTGQRGTRRRSTRTVAEASAVSE